MQRDGWKGARAATRSAGRRPALLLDQPQEGEQAEFLVLEGVIVWEWE